MPPSAPFIDRETGTIDTTQVILEAIPLIKLIGGIVAIALVPYALAFVLGGVLGTLFAVAGQFVLAVGTGIVLLYVIVRAMQLAGER